MIVGQWRGINGARVNFRIKGYLLFGDLAFEQRIFGAYRDETAGGSVLESVASRSLKFAANSRPLEFPLYEKVSPNALTRPKMKENLNYRVIAHRHN